MSQFKEYIGDSVYADWDGHAVSLTTENGLPSDPSSIIVLEPREMANLVQYAARMGAIDAMELLK